MKSSTFLTGLLCLSLTVLADGGKGGVRFGTSSQECSGGGICKATHTSTNLTQAGMDYDQASGIFLMTVAKADIGSDMFNQIGGALHFRQYEVLIIDDPKLLRMFKADGNLEIPKGNYPVSEDDKQYVIHFKAKEVMR